MKTEVIEKLKEKEVSEKVLEAKSGEEVYEIFKSKGMEISKEEAEEILKGKENLVSEISKLSEENLIQIAGGMNPDPPPKQDMKPFQVIIKSSDGNQTVVLPITQPIDNSGDGSSTPNSSSSLFDPFRNHPYYTAGGAVGLAILAGIGIKKVYNYCTKKK